MKPVVFVLAIFCGKLVQFLVCSLLTIWYGPTLLHSLRHAAHQHMGAMIGVAIAALLALIFFVVRKIFDRRKGIALPMEE
jgi:membrane protein DedA with SNARE-associated domain